MLNRFLIRLSLIAALLAAAPLNSFAGAGAATVTIHLAPPFYDPNSVVAGTAVDMSHAPTVNVVNAISRVGSAAAGQAMELGAEPWEQQVYAVQQMVDFISNNHVISSNVNIEQALSIQGLQTAKVGGQLLITNAGQAAADQLAVCMESCALLAKGAEQLGIKYRLASLATGDFLPDGREILHVVVDFPDLKIVANANWGVEGVLSYVENPQEVFSGKLLGFFSEATYQPGTFDWSTATTDASSDFAARLSSSGVLTDTSMLGNALAPTGAAAGIGRSLGMALVKGLGEGLLAGAASEGLKWALGEGLAHDAAQKQKLAIQGDNDCASNPGCWLAQESGDSGSVLSYLMYGVVSSIYRQGTPVQLQIPGGGYMNATLNTQLPGFKNGDFALTFSNGQVYVVMNHGAVIKGTTGDGDTWTGVRMGNPPGPYSYFITYKKSGTFAIYDQANGWREADSAGNPLRSSTGPTTGGGKGGGPNAGYPYNPPAVWNWGNYDSDGSSVQSCWYSADGGHGCF